MDKIKGKWIPVSERLPESKEWCWAWMKNTLSTVKDDYMDFIRAWQPYYEPEPYIEDSLRTLVTLVV